MSIFVEKQSAVLNNQELFYAFISGAQEVIKYKKELNSINVFPVADGDTGTNLASTMTGILQNARCLSTIQKTGESLADAALHYARGNSGTIFSQFISGVASILPKTSEMTLAQFAAAVKSGELAAYESVENPVEGTIISVIRDWSNGIFIALAYSSDWHIVLSEALHKAVKSLNRTQNDLPILEEHGVVDAGAKGFVIFLHGFMQYLQTGEMVELLVTDEQVEWETAHTHVHENSSLSHRYCTEALIEGSNIDIPKLKKELKSLGDSIVIAGTGNKVRLHIHTNTPDQCFRVIRSYGNIIEQKADDMVMQHSIVTNQKYKIALVTDTIADIPKEQIDHFQIHQFPLQVSVNDSTYLDRITLKATDVYEMMKTNNEHISSSQPTRKSIESLYSYLSTYYESIIVITVSKEMSGTFSAFQAVASKEQRIPITVINSKGNSAAQGLIVMKAAEAIDQGCTHEEVVTIVEKVIEKTEIFVSVDSLKGMINSGRINKTIGAIGNFVNFKPIVSIDSEGRGILLGKAFSTENNTKQILKLVQQIHERDGIEQYAIAHGNGTERLPAFIKKLISITGNPPAFIEEVSPIVASSAGENTIAVALMRK